MTDEEKLKMDWFWVSDKFFAMFCDHKAAQEYYIKNRVPMYEDEIFEKLLLNFPEKPWKMSAELHELMNRYGITDEEIRAAWKYACDWMSFSEKDFPCPID